MILDTHVAFWFASETDAPIVSAPKATAGAEEIHAESLGVSLAHVLEVGRLPTHHGVQFERLLIAQARVEGLAIVTRDHVFAQYDVPLVRT